MEDSDVFERVRSLLDSDDPRLDSRYVRVVPGDGADDEAVVLVGVVHDHPSSTYRVRRLVDRVDPDVLALELPPLALPLFRRYAEDSRTPPAFGGEMSAAIQAGDGAYCVGIDAPNRRFLASLAGHLLSEPPSLGTLRRLFAGICSVSQHTLVCRAAAYIARYTSIRVEVDTPAAYDCDDRSDARAQAEDETSHVDRARSLFSSAETPRAVRIRDEIRERCMSRRIDDLRRGGSVVAVVGIGHLDGISWRLRGPPE